MGKASLGSNEREEKEPSDVDTEGQTLDSFFQRIHVRQRTHMISFLASECYLITRAHDKII